MNKLIINNISYGKKVLLGAIALGASLRVVFHSCVCFQPLTMAQVISSVDLFAESLLRIGFAIGLEIFLAVGHCLLFLSI